MHATVVYHRLYMVYHMVCGSHDRPSEKNEPHLQLKVLPAFLQGRATNNTGPHEKLEPKKSGEIPQFTGVSWRKVQRCPSSVRLLTITIT